MIRRLIAAAAVATALLAIPVNGWPASGGSHKAVTCAVGVTAVVPDNPNRQTLVLFNNEVTNAITVGTGVPNALTAANGVSIQAKGALVLDGYTGSMSCIRNVADGDLRVLEIVR